VNFYIWMAGVLVLDQFTKILAIHYLKPFDPVIIIEPFFWLIIRQNSGAAFSLFSKHPIVLTIFNTLASAAIVIWAIRIPKKEKLMRTSLALIAGGALGNLCDRYFRGGAVIDFLDLHWFNKMHWPTFNIADMAICAGVALIFIDTIKQSYIQQKKQPLKNKK
jgi:signal peptidase II